MPVVRHLGPRSAALAERLGAGLGAAEILGPQSRELATAFAAGRPIVAIAAAGSAARVLPPHVTDKRQDPPALIIDETAPGVVHCLAGSRP